jgi:hypothetical protein
VGNGRAPDWPEALAPPDLGPDWAPAPRRRAPPLPLALPRRLRAPGLGPHRLAPWFRASGASIPVFEAELRAFARAVGAGPKKQIVLVLDQAGWHTSLKLRVPDHVHRLFLPPYSPELQPAEHLWPLTNDRWSTPTSPTSRPSTRRSSPAAPPCSASPTASAPPRCSPGGPDALRSAKVPGGTDITSPHVTCCATISGLSMP